MLTKLLSTSIIVGAFLIGCGGETNEQISQDVSMPHQVNMSSKNLREAGPDSEEYADFMRTYTMHSRLFSVYDGYIKLRDPAHQNLDLKYVFYIDSDHNNNTGYVDPWIPKAGAEFLIEDGIKYKYTGTPGSTEWSWEVIDWNAGSPYDGNGIKIDNDEDLVYGVTLNQDWTLNSFLGYVNLHDKWEYPILRHGGNKIFTVCTIDDDVYFHSYNSHIGNQQKLDDNEMYYNYEFTVGNQKFYTEGGILFNEDWTVVEGAGRIEYEVREYDAITIIPKSFFPNVDFSFDYRDNAIVNTVTVRDSNWNELYNGRDNRVE